VARICANCKEGSYHSHELDPASRGEGGGLLNTVERDLGLTKVNMPRPKISRDQLFDLSPENGLVKEGRRVCRETKNGCTRKFWGHNCTYRKGEKNLKYPKNHKSGKTLPRLLKKVKQSNRGEEAGRLVTKKEKKRVPKVETRGEEIHRTFTAKTTWFAFRQANG